MEDIDLIDGNYYYRGIPIRVDECNDEEFNALTKAKDTIDAVLDRNIFEYIMSRTFGEFNYTLMILKDIHKYVENESFRVLIKRPEILIKIITYIYIEELVIKYSQEMIIGCMKFSLHGKSVFYNRCWKCANIIDDCHKPECKEIIGDKLRGKMIKSAKIL